MLTLDKRFKTASECVAKEEHQQRLKQRAERKAKKKRDNHRNFILGQMVTQYFPEVLTLEPGKSQAENQVQFGGFEAVLATLAKDRELVEQIKERARCSAPADNYHVDSQQCVYGRTEK